MQTVENPDELRSLRAKLKEPIGFVPTMGALHAGHLALVEQARKECATVIVSIFVNPLQFGPTEDFARYPRTPQRDCEALAAQQTDLIFMPRQETMYPQEPAVWVDPGGLASHFEGERRPGHFRAVATVVLKLLNIVGPQKAYFGQKDAQQLAVIRRMVSDFNVPTEIIACMTVRDADGLALSSRNAYLSASERASALNLPRALSRIAAALAQGEKDVEPVIERAAHLLAPLRGDYLAVVSPNEFQPLKVAPARRDLLAIGAAFAGETRLIDNVAVRTP